MDVTTTVMIVTADTTPPCGPVSVALAWLVRSDDTGQTRSSATIDPAAKAINFVGTDGTGTMAVDMKYAKGADLKNSYGGTVDDAEQGEYLVVTAKFTVTEGTYEFNPFQFSVKTPYGGAVEPSDKTYSLVGSGVGGGAPYQFKAGDEYTVQILFDVKRAGGNVLEFDTYQDTYNWDVPA